MPAVSLKWIFFAPLACASTMLAFLREAAVQTPDPAWEARLAQASDQFRELTAKAAAGRKETAGDAPQEAAL